MEELSINERLEYFIHALNRLNRENLHLPDDDLLCIIGEELDVEANSFLHRKNVELLIQNHLPPQSISKPVEQLRNKILHIIPGTNSANEIRNGKKLGKQRI